MDDGKAGGPQASTRHVKERRPGYHTKAARSIAALEYRIGNLEGRQSTSASSGNPRATAAADVDNDFNNIGQLVDRLDDRVTKIESLGTLTSDVQAQLESLEQRLKPYERYETQVGEAVKQLSGFEERLRGGISPVKADNALSAQVATNSKSIESLNEHLRRVEDLAEQAKSQPLATIDLALALMHRLQRGDCLDATTSGKLRLALSDAPQGTDETASNVPPARMLETPLTDEGRHGQGTTGDSVDEGPAPKRRRVEQTRRSTRKKVAKSSAATTSSTTPGDVTSGRPTEGGLHKDQPDADEDEGDDAELEDGVPEVRRTGRKHKPSQQYHDMLSWKEARERMRKA